jgi:hypothetical protein
MREDEMTEIEELRGRVAELERRLGVVTAATLVTAEARASVLCADGMVSLASHLQAFTANTGRHFPGTPLSMVVLLQAALATAEELSASAKRQADKAVELSNG